MRHAGPLCTNWKRSPMVVQLHANWIQAHVHEQTRELEISEWQSMVQPTNKLGHLVKPKNHSQNPQ